MKSWFTSFILFALVSTLGYTQVTNKLDNLQVGTLTTKTLDVTSTVKASKPCPKMTLAERDAIVSPLEGQCVYNSTVKTLNLFDGSSWVEVAGGGDGGIANWQGTKFYDVGDVVIYLGNIYQCITQHTSGASFDPSKFNILAQDLASATGSLDASKVGTGDISNTEFSYLNNASSEIQTQLNGKEPTITTLPLNKGGTNKNATASAGSVVYSDADSFELSSVGTAGQYLQSNGASAPSWSSISVNDAGFSGVLSLGKGGTSKSLTANNGSIAYSDADSFELLAPGTSGQILQSNGAAAPSFVNKSISAKSESSAAVSLEEIQVYNDQLTQTAAGKHKIETGNKNILVNPSFEHATFSTGWTNSAGTFAEDTVVEIDGLKSASVVLSTQTFNLRQDSTSYASQFADGVQGLASARVKTSVSGVKLCARKAGTTQTSLCVNHTGSGKWELLKVPFILGGTSNGLVIQTDANVSGTVYVDDAFVGAVDLSATQSFDTTCDTIACQTEFSIKVSGGGATIFETNDWASSTRNATGNYVINFNSGVFSVSPSCQVSTSESGNYVDSQIDSLSPTAIAVIVKDSATTTFRDKQFEVFCQKQGADYTAAINAQKAFQKTKVSSYSSTNADTDWQACTFTGSWTTNTTYSGLCKRTGSILEAQVRVATSGAPNATALTITLPSGYQIDTSKISSTSFEQGFGFGTVNDSNSVGYDVIASYANATTIQALVKLANATHTQNSQNISSTIPMTWGSGDSLFLNFRVPIQGWEQSNILIGQFNGLESCKDSFECEDIYSARVSATGIITEETPGDWINGSASQSTGAFTVPFVSNRFTVAPHCWAEIEVNTTGWMAEAHTASTSQVLVKTSQGVSASSGAFTLYCRKQGVDYVSKTAKAVASDQNVRTPGVVNSQLFGAVVTNTCSTSQCTISQSFGSNITSINRTSTGQYSLTLSGLSSTPVCYFNSNETSTGNGAVTCHRTTARSSTSYGFSCKQGTSFIDYNFEVMCGGN